MNETDTDTLRFLPPSLRALLKGLYLSIEVHFHESFVHSCDDEAKGQTTLLKQRLQFTAKLEFGSPNLPNKVILRLGRPSKHKVTEQSEQAR